MDAVSETNLGRHRISPATTSPTSFLITTFYAICARGINHYVKRSTIRLCWKLILIHTLDTGIYLLLSSTRHGKITNYSLSLSLFRIKRLSRITNGDGLRSPLVFPREPGNFRRFARSTQGRASGLFLLVVICPLLRRKKEVREDRSIEV